MKHEIDKVLSKDDMIILQIVLKQAIQVPDFLKLEQELEEERGVRIATIEKIIQGLDKTEGVVVIDKETQEASVMTKETATKLFSNRRDELINELTDCERVRRLHQKISAILEFEQENDTQDEDK
jgi:hypothetical protein